MNWLCMYSINLLTDFVEIWYVTLFIIWISLFFILNKMIELNVTATIILYTTSWTTRFSIVLDSVRLLAEKIVISRGLKFMIRNVSCISEKNKLSWRRMVRRNVETCSYFPWALSTLLFRKSNENTREISEIVIYSCCNDKIPKTLPVI
jgi:hypothetical protein